MEKEKILMVATEKLKMSREGVVERLGLSVVQYLQYCTRHERITYHAMSIQ